MSTQALQAFALETFEAMITVRLVSAIQLDELQQELEEVKRERDDYKKKYNQQSVRVANLEIETWRLRRKRKRLAAVAEEATAAGNIV
jgi:ABC-type phosphate transport system auxiliary subunit